MEHVNISKSTDIYTIVYMYYNNKYNDVTLHNYL